VEPRTQNATPVLKTIGLDAVSASRAAGTMSTNNFAGPSMRETFCSFSRIPAAKGWLWKKVELSAIA
jgi:hypothetical protein